ncbi:TPA: hypothetical protein HA274_06580 [Candidatus Bathyarchaeota archaeon]|nr:hypothetical protein [Candidatus Bathyarchaeota archaeon]
MNRKILFAVASLLVISMMLTPFAFAKPGSEKNNEKFEYFELVCSGTGSGTFEKEVLSPPEGTPPNSIHRKGGGWVTGDTVELTVGTKTFDTASDPYSIDYTTTYDIEVFLEDDGTAKKYNIRLTDVVTLYYEDMAIGTLVLKITAVVEFTEGAPSGYAGTVNGYGTDALEGVHVSAVDLGVVSAPPPLYARIGTIKGWPEQITNA